MQKFIKGFGLKYFVTITGKVYSLTGKNQTQIKGGIKKAGYREVVLTWRGKKHYLLVHRIVAEAFIPNPENKRTVNHKDGNKLNNKVSNLEWNTDVENLKHARDNNLLSTKINQDIAEAIRKDKRSHRDIAKAYGIGKTTVGDVKAGKIWSE